jgi:hypothetical protein
MQYQKKTTRELLRAKRRIRIAAQKEARRLMAIEARNDERNTVKGVLSWGA